MNVQPSSSTSPTSIWYACSTSTEFWWASRGHILELLRSLRMPIVTTLHTVLREPNPDQHRVMVELAEFSDRLIVMSQHSSQFLQEIFQVPAAKIDVIPHGVPNLAFVDPNFYKDRFGVGGKSVLLTFGLLSPNKGVETVIQALPRILAHNSNVTYIVAGATHPHIRRREGDKYRESLQLLAKDLGVEKNVIFHNRFVSPEEMMEFIGSADIYITPYKNEAQVVSGTLAYALGAGKAVISTPYWHAQELLDQRRGVLVHSTTRTQLQNKPFSFWRMKLNGMLCANVRIYTHAIWFGKVWPRTTCAASREPERSACGTLAWLAQMQSAPVASTVCLR